jgi:DNA-binding response OmpR family regulator
LLEKEGYSVSEAADGSEALVFLARGEAFDLMVLDLDMPMLGGREVLRAVRGSVSTAGLPVVVLTGTQDPAAEIDLMEQGADDYIRKPIDPPRFLTRVKATLRRARG